MNPDQFDPRYKLPPRYADNPAARSRSARVIHAQLHALAGQRRRPANISWFEQALAGERIAQGRPLIGVLCHTIPLEIIYALGAQPLRLDGGNPALMQVAEEVLPPEVCPLIKSTAAMVMDKTFPASRCAALIVPAACDAKRKLAELLGDYLPVFAFALPPEQDAGRYMAMAAEQVRRMGEFLSARLGAKLSRRELLRAIEGNRNRAALVRELQEIRSARPEAFSARDFQLVLQAFWTGVDPAEWFRRACEVRDEARTFSPERPRIRPRLLVTGSPIIWPNFKIFNLIEECGADIVADTLCSGAQAFADPVVVDETSLNSLFRALAARYVFAAVCPCFPSQGRRLARILDLVEQFRVEAVVNYNLRLCQPFDIETYRMAAVLRQKRVPFLNLRTDYSLEDVEQLRVRFEAFLETLESK